MTFPPASVDKGLGPTLTGVSDLDARRFGIVNANPGAGIRLEFLVSRCESQDEVPHEHAGIDPG